MFDNGDMLKPLQKAILFDMDGTLIDTIEDIRSAFNVAFSLEGLPPFSVTLTKQVVGRGLYTALKSALSYYDHPVEEARFTFLYHSMMTIIRHTMLIRAIPMKASSRFLIGWSALGLL